MIERKHFLGIKKIYIPTMTDKRILIVTDCILPVPASKGGAVSTLIESLAKINEREKKCKLFIFTIKDRQSIDIEAQYPNTVFIQFKQKKWIDFLDKIFFKKKSILMKLLVIYQTRKFLKINNFDRVILENFGYLLKIFKDKNLLAKYEGKIFYHLHNDVPYNVDVSIIKHCKLLLVSKFLENRIEKVCGNEILKHCEIVKNGINVNVFKQQLSEAEKKQIKERLKIKKDAKTIVFVGRLDKTKGISVLLKAIQKIETPLLKLVIVGATLFGKEEVSDYEKEIKHLCETLGDKVEFTGFIPNMEVWKYYKIADVVVLPSIWDEPAGLTMVEASVSGVPLITTCSGGIPEYIKRDSAIMLPKDDDLEIKLAEAIKYTLENISAAKNKAESYVGYYSESFSEETYYDNFIKSLDLQ